MKINRLLTLSVALAGASTLSAQMITINVDGSANYNAASSPAATASTHFTVGVSGVDFNQQYDWAGVVTNGALSVSSNLGSFNVAGLSSPSVNVGTFAINDGGAVIGAAVAATVTSYISDPELQYGINDLASEITSWTPGSYDIHNSSNVTLGHFTIVDGSHFNIDFTDPFSTGDLDRISSLVGYPHALDGLTSANIDYSGLITLSGSPVPEPSTIAGFGIVGLLGFVAIRRRRRRA